MMAFLIKRGALLLLQMNYLVRYIYNRIFRRKGLYSFLSRAPRDSAILDVGCGNDSSYKIKTIFPKFSYTGLDVSSYRQTKPILADRYIVVSPENFHQGIASFGPVFDCVISSHNLEHCDNRELTLSAMLGAVKM